MGFFSFFKKKKDKSDAKKYKLSLHKTDENSIKRISDVLKTKKRIDEEVFETIEECFIESDIGVETVLHFVDNLRLEVNKQKITDVNEFKDLIIDRMFELYTNNKVVNANINLVENGISVILFVGVNGVGKTTSIAKLAYKLKNEGKKVLLAAGDTFRAGAAEQLSNWASKVGVPIVKKEQGSDPTAVLYEAYKKAESEGFDVLLCDTAGRLQNKANLMSELSKMRRVLEEKLNASIAETLLVIDATTGQNGLLQAKGFSEVTNVTGVILTKLDGTSKGGIVLAIKHLLDIPIKFVGLGEKESDLVVFDIESYLYGLFQSFFDE